VEEDLDELALAVELLVVAKNLSARWIRRDDVLHPASADGLADVAGVVARVRNAGLAASVLDERLRDRCLVLLTGRELDVKRPPLEVYDGVELGCKASTRMSQSIASEPPFPPAAT